MAKKPIGLKKNKENVTNSNEQVKDENHKKKIVFK